MADEIRAAYPELKVAMNGSMIMNYGFVQSGERDMMTLIPGMYLLMLALTWVMLRSFSGMVATLITIILSTTVALGIAGFLGMRMAPITIIAPNIILTLAVADCIHIISSMQRHLRAGMEKTAAIKEPLDHVGKRRDLINLGLFAQPGDEIVQCRQVLRIVYPVGLARAYFIFENVLPTQVLGHEIKVLARLNQNMNGDNAAFYSIPENPQLSAQYLLLYELSLPFGLDLNNQINIDKSSTRLSVIIKDIHIVAQGEFHDRVSGWIADNARDGMIENPTGISKIFGSLTLRNITEMITGNIISVVVISLLMMMTLRSIGIGAISVVTNVVPAMITFGLWAIFVGQIGLAAAVIGAASLGIVVDDSVHFLTKYLRGRREKNLNKEDAIRYAFAEVGEAILFTSIIVGAGFAMIAFSTFQVNAQLGLLTAITVIVAMFFDFLVLPAILLLGGDRAKSRVTKGDSNVETLPAE